MLPDAPIASLLAVDDDEAYLRLLERTVSYDGFAVTSVTSGEDALLAAREQAPDLVLLDVLMPGIDGFETCRRLKADDVTARIPVIFMTARERSEQNLALAFGAGGCDYVTKPFSRIDVLHRVRKVIRHRHERDMLEQLQRNDSATGLPDRTYLWARLSEELVAAARHSSELSIITADIDNLDQIADRHGVGVRELLFRHFALLLHSESSHHDVAGVWGPDMFLLMLPRVGLRAAAAAASRMCKVWRMTNVAAESETIRCTATFAVLSTAVAGSGVTGGELTRQAELALRQAQGEGGDRVSVVCAPVSADAELPTVAAETALST